MSLSFNPKSDVQSYFQKVKCFVLLCCCRKFTYSPQRVFWFEPSHPSGSFNLVLYSSLGLSVLEDKLELSLKYLNQKMYGENFCFEKIICSENFSLLTGCHFLMETKRVLQQKKKMIDKEDTFSFIQSILSSFNPGQILSMVPLKIVSSGTKFVKS